MEFSESGSGTCSPLLLSVPTLPMALLDFDPVEGEIPCQVSSSTQESFVKFSPATQYPPVETPLEIPLLYNPDCNSVLDASPGPRHHHELDRNTIQFPGSPSLRSTILTIGEDAISGSQLHRLRREVKLLIMRLEVILMTRDILLQDLMESSLPQEALEITYNALIDASDALSLRRSIILTDIGTALEQLCLRIREYIDDGTMISSINKSIRLIEEEDEKRSLMINFNALQNHRSSTSDYGCSFLQENRMVFLRTQRFLESTSHLRRSATAFMNDPMSLMNKMTPSIRSE